MKMSLEGRDLQPELETQGTELRNTRESESVPAKALFFFWLRKQGPYDLCFVRMNFPYQEFISLSNQSW